jgi:ubiquinone biosynthesis protein
MAHRGALRARHGEGRHRIQARSHMTTVNLALMTAEGLGKRLAPELSLTDAALPYLSEALAAAPRPA